MNPPAMSVPSAAGAVTKAVAPVPGVPPQVSAKRQASRSSDFLKVRGLPSCSTVCSRTVLPFLMSFRLPESR